ncbi:MAG: sigma-54 dependent transcriptional regulator [Desulfarculaceae bacterium]|jgi:DNA-binding NtrC family response regulator
MNPGAHILLADKDPREQSQLASALELEGHWVSQAASGQEAVDLLKKHGFQLVILSLHLPGINGLEILDQVQAEIPGTPVIILSNEDSVDSAVGAMRRGAHDFLQRPVNWERLLFAVRRALDSADLARANEFLRHEQPYIYRLQNIVAQSESMKQVLQRVARIATSDATVLLTGETGTGKSLLAGAIHFNSLRRKGTLVTVNCAALTDTLLESELFGHEKGAFTGAHKSRIGRFQQAHGGTLFLDEVGDMSPSLQAKILRVIEDKQIQPVGGSRSIQVDVRIITATNRDLEQAVHQGSFRGDLFYRLNVASLKIPPLRERPEDIIPLAERLIQNLFRDSKRTMKSLSGDAKESLQNHDWPGNIREMRNALERAAIFTTGLEITPEDLDLNLAEESKPAVFASETLDLAELERRAIETALRQNDWVQSKAASLLGITPRALSYKLDKLQISHPKLDARRRPSKKWKMGLAPS